MTEQPTALPTPAQDALTAAAADFDGARAMFLVETENTLNGEMTAKEAIAEAKRLTPWAQKQQSTKAAALRVIARHRWTETDAFKANAALVRAADKEKQILAAITEGPARVAAAKQDVVEKASAEHVEWNTERLLDEVIGLQATAEIAGLWANVEYAIREQHLSPMDALVAVREHAASELLTQVRYINASNSTRALTNANKASATAKWLESTDRIAKY